MPTQTQDSSASSSSVHSTLLEQLREQDAAGWERLVQIYGPLVYQWCRPQSLQASDAADVMQEVFQSVAANIRQFGGRQRGGSFRGWMWTIARNKLRDFYRREAKQARGRGGTAAMLRSHELPEDEAESFSTSVTAG